MMTDTEFEQNLSAIKRAFRCNVLAPRVRSQLTKLLISKCLPCIGIFPLSASLLTFARKLNSAVPIKFLLRANFSLFLMDMRLFAFVTFLEFVTRYSLRMVENNYQYSLSFEKDFQYVTDKTMELDFYQIPDSVKDGVVLESMLDVYDKLAHRILLRPETNIFTSEFFEQTVFPTAYGTFRDKEIIYEKHGRLVPLFIDRNGKTLKRTAEQADISK